VCVVQGRSHGTNGYATAVVRASPTVPCPVPVPPPLCSLALPLAPGLAEKSMVLSGFGVVVGTVTVFVCVLG
jgi:hypothetical protein